MAPRFRADHIGSLLRPKELIEAPQNSMQNMYTKQSLQSLAEQSQSVHEAIKTVVQKQISHNATPITSGEFDRGSFSSNFMEALPGFEAKDMTLDNLKEGWPTARLAKRMGRTSIRSIVATSKIGYDQSPYLKDWLFLKSLVPPERVGDLKWTMISPTFFHSQLKDGVAYDKSVYADDEAFFEDLIEVYRKEIRTLYDAGLRNLQIDAPDTSFFCDPEFIQASRDVGLDLDALLDRYIEVHNGLVRDQPGDLSLGIHLCRGNFAGLHMGSGSYAAIEQKLLRRLDYRLFYLEYDSDRAGDFQPLRLLPIDKVVVLGLVTTKSAEMEDPEMLKAKVYEAADIIAKGQGEGRTRDHALRDNLAISPQCGFASVSFGAGKGMDEEVMWQKLGLVRKVADEIWHS